MKNTDILYCQSCNKTMKTDLNKLLDKYPVKSIQDGEWQKAKVYNDIERYILLYDDSFEINGIGIY